MSAKTTRIKSAVIRSGFTTRSGKVVPYIQDIRIDLDTTAPIKKKIHQLIYQQWGSYGQPGDWCEYLSHEELLELRDKGFIYLA